MHCSEYRHRNMCLLAHTHIHTQTRKERMRQQPLALVYTLSFKGALKAMQQRHMHEDNNISSKNYFTDAIFVNNARNENSLTIKLNEKIKSVFVGTCCVEVL